MLKIMTKKRYATVVIIWDAFWVAFYEIVSQMSSNLYQTFTSDERLGNTLNMWQSVMQSQYS